MTSFRNQFLIFLLTAGALVSCTAPTDKPAQQAVTVETPRPTGKKTPATLSSITLEEFFLAHQSGRVLVIDARPAFVHRFGSISGSVNIPKNQATKLIPQREGEIRSAIAAGKTIVVYCTNPGCPDAHAVAMQISEAGYPVSVFSGGWEAWQQANLTP